MKLDCAPKALPSGRSPKKLKLAAVAAALVVLCTSTVALAQQPPAAKKDDKKDEKKDDKKSGASVSVGASATTTPAPAAEKKDEEKETTKELDGKRAVYLGLEFGFTRPDFGAFSDSTSLDRTGANGWLYGFGGGVRLDHLRIGARFRGLDTTEFTLWELMAEIGWGFGLRPVSPAIFLHAGYVFDIGLERSTMAKSLPQGNVLAPDVDVKGLVVGVEGSFAYYLSKTLRVGPFIGFDLLVVSRQKADVPQSIFPISEETRQQPLFAESGSGLGYTLNIGMRGAFDVAF